MALKVELKPNERIVIGTAVVTNGETRIRFFIEGEAPILREKDILTPSTADTPAKTIYLSLQGMYLANNVDQHYSIYFNLVADFLKAAPSALPYVAEINNHILNDELYKALRKAKRLIAYEADLVNHASGGPRLREDGAGDPLPASSGSFDPDASGKPAPKRSGRVGGKAA